MVSVCGSGGGLVEFQIFFDGFNALVGCFGATLIATCTLEGGIFDFKVELDLGFGT